MIQFIDFGKIYKNSFTIRAMNFTIQPCTITGLVGLNGAGKTTLLKAIAGIHYPDEGSIFVNGINVAEKPLKNKLQTAFIPENIAVPTEFTVKDFLYFHSKLYTKKKYIPFKKELFLETIHDCFLEDVLEKKIKHLSKGFRQRVMIASGLLSNPQVLILDEIGAGLDPIQMKTFALYLKKLALKKTIIFSTHDISLAERLCNELLIIHNGRLIAQGTISEICNRAQTQNLEEAFFYFTQKKEL